MRGHVRQRGKAWSFVIDEPRGADGKHRQRWRSGFPTRKAAERALADAMKALNDGAYVEPSRQTFGQFLEGEWLPSMKARLRPSTWASYSSIVKLHVVPRVGGIQLQALAPAALNKLYADLQLNGRQRGDDPLSARTVRLAHAIVRKALTDAMRWGKSCGTSRTSRTHRQPPSSAPPGGRR